MNIKNMVLALVKGTIINLEHGFYSVHLTDGTTIQCCLETEPCGAYAASIDLDDCGYDWGICADVNKQAFESYIDDEILLLFMLAAQSDNLKVRGAEHVAI